MSTDLDDLRLMGEWGIVKLTAERKNPFHSAGTSSGFEVLTSHLGVKNGLKGPRCPTQPRRCAALTVNLTMPLAEMGKKLGKKVLEEVATIVTLDTILVWYHTLVAQKFDGSQQRKTLGRPRIDKELEALIVRLAQENHTWGYDRIVGALANLGYTVSDQTVGNILKRHGVPPARERQKTTTWHEFIRTHMDVLVATDFFTTEVGTWCGLVTYSVLFFIHLGSRKVHVAGVTVHPDQHWMRQIARDVTMDG
jgi:putative transposase